MNKSKKNCLKKKSNILQKIKKVKGTRDLLGNQIILHNNIIAKFVRLCKSLNFSQISTPILEYSEVFTKSLGLSSDIVSKEMYNFEDQGKERLVLRPEGTAAIARAIITNSIEQDLNKFFYYGPMFRRERPQSGRLRQFHQVGVEYIGSNNYLADLEVIILAEEFLKDLKIRQKLVLEINSLGNEITRKKYNKLLKSYLNENFTQLSDLSKERLKKNPLRVLDSKEENDIKIVQNSPSIIDFLDDESKRMFENLVNGLEKLGVDYNVNRYLVRGLDYYNHSAFEYVTEEKKSQNTVLAGGRYNQLFASIGGKDLSGVGWAAGIERIEMQINDLKTKDEKICFFSTNNELDLEVLKIIANLKINSSSKVHFINSGNLKKKFSKANKIGAIGSFILGEDEWKMKKIKWKDFSTGAQELLELDNIDKFLNKKFCEK